MLFLPPKNDPLENILEHLNEEQRLAVEHIEGPLMVIAGAGSGKTRVLTYRVAHLINLGVDPFNILALTFTNKAAKEMKERIVKLVENRDARNVWMGTFHSVFAKILRIEGHRLGYPSNYTIYDMDDSKSLIRTIIKEQQLDNKVYVPNQVLGRISAAKTNLLSAEAYNDNTELMTRDKMSGKPMTGHLYTLYQNRCYKASAMDFDDLLFNTFKLLHQFPDVLYKYQVKFKYILVDEYQDTNYVQYMIVKKLAANNENICVVGDDAQSIYAFRGANIQNILNLKRDYPDLKTYKLEQNYRSTKVIVSAANGVIVNNKDQIFKKIWTHNEEGNKINLLKATTDGEEGTLVANAIFESKMNYQLSNSNFAILYRTNAQSRAFEESLRKLNIAYRIYGGLSFYKRKEIKDLLAYFRLVINHSDEEALVRIINYPTRGIGTTSIQKIMIEADKRSKSPWEIIEQMPDGNIGIAMATQNRIILFVTFIKSFSVQLKKKDAYTLAREIASSAGILKELYEDKTPEGLSRFENIEELLNAIKEFTENESVGAAGAAEEEAAIAVAAKEGKGEREEEKEEEEQVISSNENMKTLDTFMHDVALLTDAENPEKDNLDHVSLMTIHAAKGLEFPYVFVVGMEENLFPSVQSLGSRADLEEERRLFYVAVTRAEKQLTLSFAENRYRWGNLTVAEPSRFIDEIAISFINLPRKVSFHRNGIGPSSSGSKITQAEFAANKGKKLKKITHLNPLSEDNFETSDLDKLQNGMEVEHQRFGRGKVISIEGAGPNKKATVFFKNIGQKQLLLRFAKLKIL